MTNDSTDGQRLERDTGKPEWVRIFPGESELSWGRMRQWTLALSARRIPHRRQKTEKGWHLLVPPRHLGEAEKEISLFEQENRNWPPPADHPELADNSLVTLSVLGLLAIFHNVTLMDIQAFGHAPVNWVGLGNADAHKILNGQWWRIVTALTLHADALHLLGNIGIGGFVLVLACRQLGSGLGWSLVLLSGAAGNLLNAWVYHSGHRSVGASTAIFGAVGLLAGISMVQKRHPLIRGWLWPLAAALALLALLGVGDENTDIGAHLFGFMAGILPGLLAGRRLRRAGHPSPRVNVLLALLALLTVVLAWALALNLST